MTSTFAIRTPPQAKTQVKYTFVGEQVERDVDQRIYHEKHSSSSDIKALRLNNKTGVVLKSDGSTEDCAVTERLEWRAKYEILLNAISIENTQSKNENYIIASGWLNQSICIGAAEEATIRIAGTDVKLKIQYEEYYGWNIDVERGACEYIDSFHSNSDTAEQFAPDSDVVRMGFDQVIPESIDVEYYEQND